jgi:general secretion pathway protein H
MINAYTPTLRNEKRPARRQAVVNQKDTFVGDGLSRDGGFTILELLVVVLIISLGIITAISNNPLGSQSLQARAFADTLALNLDAARMEAISHGKLVVFSINRAHRTIDVNDKRTQVIPPNVSISGGSSITTPNTDPIMLRFAPNGTATEGRIRISIGRALYIIDINWLNGLARLSHGN